MLNRETARLLGKIGMMGLWQGRFVESETIFNALAEAEPGRIGPVLGQGMACMHKGDFSEAVRIFQEKALSIDPKDEDAQAWLGAALYRNGQTGEARTVLEALLENGPDGPAKEVARGVLELMDA